MVDPDIDMSPYTYPAGFNGKSTQDVREMINAARNGSFEDVKYLAISAPAIPTEVIGEALEMFCQYLDVTPEQLNIAPCSIYSPAVTMQYGFGVMALNGLGFMSRPANVAVLSCVARSWPSIAKWAKFYYEDKLSGGPVWTTPPKDKRIEAVAEAQALTVLAGVMAYASSSTGSAETRKRSRRYLHDDRKGLVASCSTRTRRYGGQAKDHRDHQILTL